MFKTILASSLVAFAFSGCGTKKVESTSKSAETSVTMVSNENSPCQIIGHGVQYSVYTDDVGTPEMSQTKLPMQYTAYVIEESSLNNYMRNLKLKTSQTMTLPTAQGCLKFHVNDSGTMSAELQQRHPEIISLRGHDNYNNTADIDYDGTNLRVKINTQDDIYLLEPVVTNRGKFYLLHLIRHSGYPKSNFEPKNK